jgi:hypothetical protein
MAPRCAVDLQNRNWTSQLTKMGRLFLFVISMGLAVLVATMLTLFVLQTNRTPQANISPKISFSLNLN